jgi:asparagine synthetase A
MVEAKLLRKKLKDGLIVDKWDLVTIIEKQEVEIAELEIGLKNVWKVVEGKQVEIEALKEQLEDCTCQGGHSEAYLKAKGKLK